MGQRDVQQSQLTETRESLGACKGMQAQKSAVSISSCCVHARSPGPDTHTKHMLRVTAGGMVACPSLLSASKGLQTCRDTAGSKALHRCKEC